MTLLSMIWSTGGASVQLLLNGKYRAINNAGSVKLFDMLGDALSFAQSKVKEIVQ